MFKNCAIRDNKLANFGYEWTLAVWRSFLQAALVSSVLIYGSFVFYNKSQQKLRCTPLKTTHETQHISSTVSFKHTIDSMCMLETQRDTKQLKLAYFKNIFNIF